MITKPVVLTSLKKINKEIGTMGLIELKSDVELNHWVNEMATTINKINEEAASKGDVDLVAKENADLKALLEVNKVEMTNVKELMKNRFTVKSDEEKMFDFGKFIFAARTNNIDQVHKLGGSMNLSPGDDSWKDDGWSINAAPDVGTPLRGDATTGSYLVPEAFAAEILRIPDDPSAMMNQVRTVPMNVRKINYPTAANGVSFTWPTNEITAKTEKSPTFSEIELEAKTAAGWIAFTEELNEDSLVPLGSYFATIFREAWQEEFDTQCLNSAAAPFTGVLQNTGVETLNMGATKVAFDDVTFDDLYNLIAKLTTQSKRNGAKFIMHTTVLDIFKKIKDDLGNYIWQQPNGLTPGTLCGYNVILSDAMPDASSSAVSTAFVAFGNPKHILHGNRIGLEIKVFDQTMDTLVYDRMFLRARLRQGFVTALPGGFAILKTASA